MQFNTLQKLVTCLHYQLKIITLFRIAKLMKNNDDYHCVGGAKGAIFPSAI